MALTRSFKELVQKRVANDPAFGEALLREGARQPVDRLRGYEKSDSDPARLRYGDGRTEELGVATDT